LKRDYNIFLFVSGEIDIEESLRERVISYFLTRKKGIQVYRLLYVVVTSRFNVPSILVIAYNTYCTEDETIIHHHNHTKTKT